MIAETPILNVPLHTDEHGVEALAAQMMPEMHALRTRLRAFREQRESER